jgi:hypothetical protein
MHDDTDNFPTSPMTSARKQAQHRKSGPNYSAIFFMIWSALVALKYPASWLNMFYE